MDTKRTHINRRCRPIVASAILVSAVLATVAAQTQAASGSERAALELTQTRTISNRPAVRPSYGWPVKPFNRQHPVRGYLNDPRNGNGAKNFHFGIDISAPDGTAVYAVAAGQVFLRRGRDRVAVRGASRTFGYWHVVPAVRNHQVVRVHELLGHVARGENHVHLAERVKNEYLNPLRPGGIGPYVDHTAPTVSSVQFLRGGRQQDGRSLTGRVDIVVEIFDTTPLVVPKPWSNLPVTPARIRWSVALGSRRVVRARTAADFRRAWLPGRFFDSIYARGTRKNSPGAPGHYRFYLQRNFAASSLPAGLCRLRIEAVDTRGNRVVAEVEIARADPAGN